MAPSKLPPMQDYAHKMMLLEAIRCYTTQDYNGLQWIEVQMFAFVERMRELDKRD
jgi:hypothetical protein